MKYLAHVSLQKRLACLPRSLSLSSDGETILGIIETDRCDLSDLRRGPFHENFANWRSTSDGIAEFTRRFGILDWEGKFADHEQVSGLRFGFLTDLWRERQLEFRELWETARTEGPEGATFSTLSVAGDFPVASEADRYSKPQGHNEDGLIWQGPETLWARTSEGPMAHVMAKTTWQYLCLLLTFEKPENLRKCENPDCAAPYFVARRKNRMFCSEDCAHRIAVRRWWTKHGNEWRQTRRRRRTKR